MASLTRAATERAYRSKSRARRRLRLIQARVRSTIQRLGQDDKFVQFVALDDLDHPMAAAGSGSRHAWSLVAGIGEDALDKREGSPRGAQQVARAVAVLHIGRVNGDAQEEAQRIDQDVALAAGDLLPRIKALRVERTAPF